MHVNQSLARGEENAFLDEAADLSLSPECRSYIAGVLAHLPAITAVANPTVNSYKRLLPGYEAPVYIAWSPGNRSAAIRVPATRGRSTRIELRTPDPTANPYLALACMLEAGRPRAGEAENPTRSPHPPPLPCGEGRTNRPVAAVSPDRQDLRSRATIYSSGWGCPRSMLLAFAGSRSARAGRRSSTAAG